MGYGFLEDVLREALNHGRDKAGRYEIRHAMDLESTGVEFAAQFACGITALMPASFVLLTPQEHVSRDGHAEQATILQYTPHLAEYCDVIRDRLKHVAAHDAVEGIGRESQLLRKCAHKIVMAFDLMESEHRQRAVSVHHAKHGGFPKIQLRCTA